MSDNSPIEWTEATWNPVRGCTRASWGCGGPGKHGGCYAESIAARFSGPGMPYEGFAEMKNGEARWTGKLALVESQLDLPLRWRKPRRVFVNSMSDLFHENLPDEAIDKVFAVMALAPQHTFQVLTKRADRMRAYFRSPTRLASIMEEASGIADRDVSDLRADGWPLPNVWLGVSCEDQERADERIPDLLATPAAVRFVSLEPLLGPIILHPLADGTNALTSGTGPNLDWVIVGGESGPRARPMNPAWARSLRDQCKAAGVPFFFKQWGEWSGPGYSFPDGRPDLIEPDDEARFKIGKKLSGRLLDGIEHNEYPTEEKRP